MTAGPRSCRPCGGGGEGESWGTPCAYCGGTGEAAADAPPRLRISAERPANADMDRLARLIDATDRRHPEVHAASNAIGRSDFTADQCAAYIACLDAFTPAPTLRTTTVAIRPRRRRLNYGERVVVGFVAAIIPALTLILINQP